MNKLKTLLAAVCCLCAANKAAAYDFSAVNDGQTIYYNIISSTPPLTVGVTYENFSQGSYNGEITIPDMVSYNGNTYSVTAIGYRAFYECTALTSVTIPNSVTTIGGYAFHSCTGLTSVTIGNSVTVIQNAVFYGCTGLTSITIPESVTDIGQSAFAHCSGLTSITIPNSVTMIEDWAFEFCSSLTSVTIPNSVTSIGREVLNSCSSLTSIIVEANNPNYCSVDDVLFNKSQSTLKQYPGGKQGSYTIPNTVTTIEYAAFSGCNLTSVTIPNSVTSIRGGTFVGCHSLISLTVEEDNPNYCSVGGVLFDKSKDTLIQYPGGKTGSYTTPYT
ncbi:MAG: leucine-rich repeat domain-containing protein, partial [Bacteroidales bacterium]|nr:leucine-rich repeat domain-containing protein [Bacteroidales bacterium]